MRNDNQQAVYIGAETPRDTPASAPIALVDLRGIVPAYDPALVDWLYRVYPPFQRAARKVLDALLVAANLPPIDIYTRARHNSARHQHRRKGAGSN